MDIAAIAKLTHGQVQAVDVHPGNEHFLAVGDDFGEIGIWFGPDKFINLRPHFGAINDLSFQDGSNLIFSCQDGYMKKMDFQTQTISIVYEGSEEPILWHQKFDTNAILIGHSYGARFLDLRSPKKSHVLPHFSNEAKISVCKFT